jgi:long-chain acyl-CoA synthetase
VAPAPIEARLKGIPGVGQAVAVGDRRHYVAALLFLDPDRLAEAAAAAGSPASDPEQGARCPLLRAWLEARVEEVNQGLARYESVRRFAVLPRPLTLESGELTPSLKLKRRVVAEHYAAEIDELYREGAA